MTLISIIGNRPSNESTAIFFEIGQRLEALEAPVNWRPIKVIIIIYSHQSRKKERYWSKSHYRSNTMYYDWVMAVPDPNSTVDTL